MLHVKTPDEALEIIRSAFVPLDRPPEEVPLSAALGRVLALDVTADAYVPDFHRSTVDGYAVRAADTFGCSDALPAQLLLSGAVRMGEGAELCLDPGQCAAVPTGGEVPRGRTQCRCWSCARTTGTAPSASSKAWRRGTI